MPNMRRRCSAFDLRDVDAIDQDLPTVDFIETHQQVDQGRLAGAGWADNRDHLSWFDVDVHVLD